MSSLGTLTWDTAILAALGVILAYTIIIHRHKALASLLSVYIAYLVAATWGQRIAEFFSGNRTALGGFWVQANVSADVVQGAVLVVTAVLLTIFLKLGGRRSRYTILEIVAYGVSTIALAVVLVVSFLDPATRDVAIASSKILPYLYAWREWVLGIPVLLMLIFGIYGNAEE